jgi:hypothetical protein
MPIDPLPWRVLVPRTNIDQKEQVSIPDYYNLGLGYLGLVDVSEVHLLLLISYRNGFPVHACPLFVFYRETHALVDPLAGQLSALVPYKTVEEVMNIGRTSSLFKTFTSVSNLVREDPASHSKLLLVLPRSNDKGGINDVWGTLSNAWKDVFVAYKYTRIGIHHYTSDPETIADDQTLLGLPPEVLQGHVPDRTKMTMLPDVDDIGEDEL